MGWIRSFYRSTIGKKVVMAVTGLVGVGFVCGHLLGNLLVFKGPEAINAWGELLKSNTALLWTVRVTMLTVLTLHVSAAYSLTMLNRRARPADYDRQVRQSSTLSALTLRVGGVILLAFIVFHLLHFTTGTVHPAFSPTDVYGNMVIGFGSVAVVGFYLLAMASLGLHLHHGLWSFFQTMGWNHPHLNPARRRLAMFLAIVVGAGFSVIPLAVAFGLVQ
jgi:succinate dehydrogenase / fumarate reductase cytochrome b subunit